MGRPHGQVVRNEKAKVKLKSLKLKKDSNITKTEFKVQKIIIRSQLETSEEGYFLKKAISGLKHHNSNFRFENLRKLRDDTLKQHIRQSINVSDLVHNVVALCLDEVGLIRKESFRVLNTVLYLLTSSKVAPFFHIIASYLCCAMTHIHSSIQKDSLLMLDVLLLQVPELLKTYSTKIVENFLQMISRFRNDGYLPCNLITLQANKIQTTMKWRCKILLSLQKLLHIIVTLKRKHKSKQKYTTTIADFNTIKSHYYPLKRFCPADIVCDFTKYFNYSIFHISQQFDESNELRFYVAHLMPLLLEIRHEIKLNEPHNKKSLYSADDKKKLNTITDIAEQLWLLINLYESDQIENKDFSTWFQTQYKDILIELCPLNNIK